MAKKFHRPGHPYGECHSGWNNKNFPTCSQAGAKAECMEKFIINKCGCVWGNNYIPEKDKVSCYNTSDESANKMMKCFKNAVDELGEALPCEFQVWSCNELQYVKIIYQYEWPDFNSTHDILEETILNDSRSNNISCMNFYPYELIEFPKTFPANDHT